MIDVTALIREWIRCSNDLWLRWFASTACGVSEFPGVDFALLNAMVLERGGLSNKGVSPENIFERMYAIYATPIEGQSKQFCVVQRSGNVFCRPEIVSAHAGSRLHVRSIDNMGTMNSGAPYVEVELGGGYFLESPDAVDFVIDLG